MVLKMHEVHGGKLPQDLVLSLRAIAAETTQVGYHFYMLYQVCNLPPTLAGNHASNRIGNPRVRSIFCCAIFVLDTWMLSCGQQLAPLGLPKLTTLLQPPTRDFYYISAEVKETQLTREEVLENLPLDLHPFVIIHDFEEDFASYPALGMHDGDVFPTELWVSHAGLFMSPPLALATIAIGHSFHWKAQLLRTVSCSEGFNVRRGLAPGHHSLQCHGSCSGIVRTSTSGLLSMMCGAPFLLGFFRAI